MEKDTEREKDMEKDTEREKDREKDRESLSFLVENA